MIRYPEGLPAPLIDYGFQPENAILRTPMQSGRARQRTLYTSMPDYTQIEWLFGGSCGTTGSQQAQLFLSWVRKAARHEWVLMPIRSPNGREQVEVRFMETPSGPFPVDPRSWRFTGRVEIRELYTLPGDWAETAPEYVLMSDIFDRAMNFHWPEWQYSAHSSIFDQAINQEWPTA